LSRRIPVHSDLETRLEAEWNARRGNPACSHAAVAYGRDDATALALGGFVISITEHDHSTAFEAFDQALAISPSSSFTLFFGSLALAFAGEAERAIDWAERALRISPFDRLNYISYLALAKLGRIEEAKAVALQVLKLDPTFSAGRIRAAIGLPTALAKHLADAWSEAGLPP
jgi:tetratricopeptide (TPR) repeat protein